MMGILSGVGKFLKRATEQTLTAVQQPVKYVSSTISDIRTGGNKTQTLVSTQLNKPLGSQIKDIIISTGTAAAITVAAAPTVVRSAIVKAAPIVGKALIPKTPKQVIATAIAAPIIAGAILKEPVAVTKSLTSAPKQLAQFGGDVATFAANPSISSAKNIISESPLISAGVGLALGGTALKLAAPIVGGIITRDAIQDQTKVLKESISLTDLDNQKVLTPSTNLAPVQPVTAQTTTKSETTTTKRKKYKKKAVLPTTISQKVNVNVGNRSSKTYIKERLLLK